MDTPTFLAHLQTHDTPLTLPRGGTLHWDDADLHRAAHTAGPEHYALLALARGARPWQRARVLLQTLAATQAGLDDPTRATLARLARVLTLALPPAHVITVLLALRRLRANHKHTTRTVLRFVLEHPDADALIAARRPALLDCFEHALGKTAARGCARRIAAGAGDGDGDGDSDYLRRRLLRFLAVPAAAPARVQALYTPATATARDLPDRPALTLDTPHRQPPTDTGAGAGTDRGDILPRFPGTLALVLDASAPARGHRDRRWAVPSQAAALRTLLARICDRLEVIQVGGDEHAPRRATDLAAGVQNALHTAPDLVAVITDGHEHRLPGDLAPATAPVVLCHDAPPAADDPADLLPWLFAHCPAGRPWLHTALHARLDEADRHAADLTAALAA